VNQQKYGSDVVKKSAELNDELAPTHKQLAELAQRYAAYSEANKKMDALRDELMAWIEREGPQTVEGVGTLIIQNRTTYSYDVKAIAANEPQRFAELLELDCLEISRKKAQPHERLHWLKAWEIPGSTPALTIDKRNK
jgi:hypothetical protein